MNWLHRMVALLRRPHPPRETESTRAELHRERSLRRAERRRTYELAKVLDDYRRQDQVMRR